MTDSTVIALACIGIIPNLFTSVMVYMGNRQSIRNGERITKLTDQTNGLTDHLVKLAGKEAYSRGRSDVNQGLPDSGQPKATGENA